MLNNLIERDHAVRIGNESLGKPVSLEDGKVKAPELSKAVYLWATSNLRSTERLERGDPLRCRFSVKSR